MRFKSLIAALMFMAVTVLGPPVGAATDPSYSVAPTPDVRSTGARDYLRLEAQPSMTVNDSLVVTNLSDIPIELSIKGVEVSTGPLGGVSYATGETAPVGVGAWISIGSPSLGLAPRATSTVTVRVDVPAGARSGTHLGGVAVTPSPPVPNAGTQDGGVGAGVRVGVRRVIAVEVTIPGPAAPELVVSGVEPAARPGGVHLLIDIANVGRGMTKAEGSVEIPGLGFRQAVRLDTFVPETSIAYPVRLTDTPTTGQWTGRVELRYGSQLATWEGQVVIGPQINTDLERRQVTNSSAYRPPGASSSLWPPIAGSAGAGAALVGVIGAVVATRRRRSALANHW